MLLSTRVQQNFPSAARTKGAHYARTGKVSEPKLGASRIDASVDGVGKPCEVALDWSDAEKTRTLVASCTFPHSSARTYCDHVWAAILKADPLGVVPGNVQKLRIVQKEPVLAWRQMLATIQRDVGETPSISKPAAKPGSRMAYFVLNVPLTLKQGSLVVDFWARERNPDGELGWLKACALSPRDLKSFPDALDRDLLTLLLSKSMHRGDSLPRSSVPPSLHENLLFRLASTGRLFASKRKGYDPEDLSRPLLFDPGSPFKLVLTATAEADQYVLSGKLTRGQESFKVSEPLCFLTPNLIVFPRTIGKFEQDGSFTWAIALTKKGGISVPKADGRSFAETILSDPKAPPVEWPEDLRGENLQPQFKISLKTPDETDGSKDLKLTVAFDYPAHKLQQPNDTFEHEILSKVRTLGAEGMPARSENQYSFSIAPEKFPRVAREMLTWGWPVDRDGKKVRPSGSIKMKLKSGADWFELAGNAEFGASSAPLPELLTALQNSDSVVPLKDGSVGLLPDDWMTRYAPLVALGKKGPSGVRFSRPQGLLLDSWLGDEGNLKRDPVFQALQTKIRSLQGLKPKSTPKGFRGKLRPYQEQGYAWLGFLADFGLGGILADDMGLGKTIELLAFLQDRKQSAAKGEKKLPSLVIVPKSVVYNWIEEARRFTPKLKSLDYSGLDRKKKFAEIPKMDLVVTTYATLRLDIEKLKGIEFDCVVADEAQMIKNPEALVTRALKLINGKFRLAMTGTPIENSLKDLFSIMEFVNPSLLTKALQEKCMGENPALESLSRALRPVILRRTKGQVVKELPQKMEQTLYCELGEQERKLYNELRDYYRVSLKEKISLSGIAKSRIEILTALLRLRQAACHPGLVDPSRSHRPSAKLTALVDQLLEITREGHKALVFSQFTTFLDIVRKRLESQGLRYEYLDGKTKDRKTRVERFQREGAIRIFLLSLKAGGVGLNLTGADYVYLLDPWWNPAVEAQAIDRAHRIGQRKKVFAYRLIANGTVEDKIIQMQKDKRDLADAIVTEDTNFLKKMTSEDLQALLS